MTEIAAQTAPKNDVKAIKAYFSTSDRPVEAAEFREFWTSLTSEEREFYKTAADLT